MSALWYFSIATSRDKLCSNTFEHQSPPPASPSSPAGSAAPRLFGPDQREIHMHIDLGAFELVALYLFAVLALANVATEI